MSERGIFYGFVIFLGLMLYFADTLDRWTHKKMVSVKCDYARIVSVDDKISMECSVDMVHWATVATVWRHK